MSYYRDGSLTDRADKIAEVVGAVLLIVVVYLASAGLWRGFVAIDRSFNPYSYSIEEVLEAQGVKLNEPTPLALGATLAGPQGSFQTSGNSTSFILLGSTSYSVSGSIQPGLAVRLGMRVGDKNYIMSIPESKVHFVDQAGATPQATFALDGSQPATNPDFNYHYGSFWGYGLWHADAEQPSVHSARQWQHLVDQGPGALIQEHLTSITLTVTPEQYEAYLKNRPIQ
jgi:hypothetical protein